MSDRRGADEEGGVPVVGQDAPDLASASVDGAAGGRVAWLSYLRSLATSADAALGCALAYEELPHSARAELVSLLEADVAAAGASRLAVVAPLLAVERDEALRRALRKLAGRGRRRRLARATLGRRAFVAEAGRERALALATPAYLGFADLVVARLADGGALLAVATELVEDARALARAAAIAAVPVDAFGVVPWADAVDELAGAVLASRREGRALPPAAPRLAELFEVSLV